MRHRRSCRSGLSGRGEIETMAVSKWMIVLFVSITALTQEASAPTEEDWNWLSKNEGTVLEELLPNKYDFGTYLGYRAVRDLYIGVPEYSFVIGFEADTWRGTGVNNYLTAHVREPEGSSVREQLMSLPSEVARRSRRRIEAHDQTEGARPHREGLPSSSSPIRSILETTFPSPGV
jgi:hypothetical protein